jgi:integrase
MPRRAKGPHYWFRPDRKDASGKVTQFGTWLILDGTRQHSTGLGARASAEEKDTALEDYLAQKKAPANVGSRDPSKIEIADVLTKYYADKIAPKLKHFEAGEMQPNGRPAKRARWIQIDGGTGAVESRLRVIALREFWCSEKVNLLSHVNGDRCREYAGTRKHGAARRELEDFRAAINHHRREGLHDKIVSVVLPEKSEPSEDYLTVEEAAALIRSAWRYREQQNHRGTDRATRKHVARFMVVARYMGSRAAVICEASIEPKRPDDRAWIDLRTGMLYGLPKGRKQSKKRRQLVKVPAALLAHLRRWRKNGQRYAVEWNGKPIAKVRKAHDATVTACHNKLARHVSPHIWRHTVATWLMQGGGDPFKIAGFLAMSLATLLRVYGHHHPDHSADVHETMRKKKRAA